MVNMQIPASFHAHIYFTAETRDVAQTLLNQIVRELGPILRYAGKLIDRPIGPHPVPMFEIDFLPQHFLEVVTFLMANHRGLSALIHPQTGEDLLDHSEHALWLGKQLPLKLDIF